MLVIIPFQMALFRATRKQSCANAMSLTGLLPINEGKESKTDKCYNNRMLHKYKKECVYGHKSKQILKYI